MSATEDAINNLNVAKLMLCNPQMLNPEMCIKIGQAITSAITLLKESESIVRCRDCKHFYPEKLYMCRIHGSAFQPKDRDWFCADGEKDGGQTKRHKETFWDSLSEADLMEPMHHFED